MTETITVEAIVLEKDISNSLKEEIQVDENTTLEEKAVLSCPEKAIPLPRRPSTPGSIRDYLIRATGKIKYAIMEEFRDLLLVHHNINQHTFVFNGKDLDGEYRAIKLWIPAPWLSQSENRRREEKFEEERDLLFGIYNLTHKENVVGIRSMGVKKYAGSSFLMYFTTDYLEKSFRDLRVGSIKKMVQVTRKVAETLSFLHEHYNLIHRDITPNNIMLNAQDEPMLIDFGAMQSIYLKDRSSEIGTIPYISPKQAETIFKFMVGRPVPNLDYTADMYSLGTTLANTFFKDHPGNRLEALREFYSDPEEAVFFYRYIAFGPDIPFPSTGNQALDEFIYRSRTKTDAKYKSMREAVEALRKIEEEL